MSDARRALEADGTEPEGHGAECISFAVYSSPFPTALSLMIGPDEPFNLRVQRTLAQAEVRVFLGSERLMPASCRRKLVRGADTAHADERTVLVQQLGRFRRASLAPHSPDDFRFRKAPSNGVVRQCTRHVRRERLRFRR